MWIVQCAKCSVQCAQYNVHSAMYRVRSTVCIVHSVMCIVYSAICMVQWVQYKLEDQLNISPRQTSQTNHFLIFEALANLPIRRLTFQFVYCHSFRVRRRPCSYKNAIAADRQSRLMKLLLCIIFITNNPWHDYNNNGLFVNTRDHPHIIQEYNLQNAVKGILLRQNHESQTVQLTWSDCKLQV